MDHELGSPSKPFTVVLFPCDNSVEAVPTKWISSDKKDMPVAKQVFEEYSFAKADRGSKFVSSGGLDEFQCDRYKGIR
jgi:hypothetical protein